MTHRCRNPVRVGDGKLQRPIAGGQLKVDVDAPFGRLLFQHPFERLIPVAVEGRAFHEGLGQVVGENPPAFDDIDAHALQLVGSLVRQGLVAHAVAIVELYFAVEFEPVAANRRDHAQHFSGKLGRIESTDIGLASMHEVVGGASVKRFFRLRHEMMGTAAGRRGSVLRMLGHEGVEQLAVVRGGVFDIGHVFVAAFDLE